MTGLRRAIGVLVLSLAGLQAAEAGQRWLDVDFHAAMDRQNEARERFAVDVGQHYDLADGDWSDQAGLSVWTLDLSVTDARSLSFFADDIALPAGAGLILSNAAGVSYRHDPRHWASGQLWSRPMRGDALHIEIQVPTHARAEVRLSIARVQAGFRDLLDPDNDHPAYRNWKSTASSPATASGSAKSSASGCDTNYACRASDDNRPQGQSTVQVVFGNSVACTGTLIADADGSFRTYIATANHCALLAESVGADSSAFAFNWNAEVPCGESLPSAYSADTGYSQGGIVRAVNQDLLLIEANDPPPQGTYPFWAGWDVSTDASRYNYASNGPMESVHHGNHKSRQYFSASSAKSERVRLTDDYLGSNYKVDAWTWETTFGSGGRVTPGASGAGAFVGHRLVGTLSGSPTTEVCSASDSVVTYYQRLAAAFNSGGSASASPQYWLDPSDAGVRQVDGGFDTSRNGAPLIDLAIERFSLAAGESTRLNWHIERGASCSVDAPGVSGVANLFNGGVAEDGSAVVSASALGSYAVNVRCTSEGGRTTNRSVSFQIAETGGETSPPEVWATRTQVAASDTVTLNWKIYDDRSCEAIGDWNGTLTGSGSRSLHLATGAHRFGLNCESVGAKASETQVEVVVYPDPVLSFTANRTSVEPGESVSLSWAATDADACRASGDWFGAQTANGSKTLTPPNGTSTYTMICSGQASDVEANVTITVAAKSTSTTSPSSGSSGGSGGGGGAFGSGLLGLLLATGGLRRLRRSGRP